MATPKFNDAELKDILNEVAEDLQKAFDKEKEALAKGFPPDEGSASGSDSSGSSASEGSASAPEASASEGSGSMPEGSADMGSASDEGAPGEGAPGEGGDPAADAGAELTPEALQAEYAKLDPQELEMHIHAALAAKEALMGADGAAGAPPMAPPAADGLAMKGEMSAELSHEVSKSPSQHNRDAQKKETSESGGELSHSVSMSPSQHNRDMSKNAPMTPEKVKAMAKAEVAEVIAELKAELKSAHEDVENLTKAVTTLMEKPLRKSITSVRPSAADEARKDISNLTMQDVQKHLIKLTARPDLKKSDRELINNFYDRRAKITDLAHLFEDYK